MASRLVVLGSINLDLVTRVAKHPVPGETVMGEDYQMLPGGKGANQALAAAQALTDASRVHLIGATGQDDFSNKALHNLKNARVNLANVIKTKSGTGIALIAVAHSGENNIIVCPGANADVTCEPLSHLKLSGDDVLLTQQEIPATEVWRAHSMAKAGGATVIHNAAPAAAIPVEAFENMDVLIVNESEAMTIGAELVMTDNQADSICSEIASGFGLEVILTLGERGAVRFAGESRSAYPAKKTNVVDTTGAGDVFCGTFAALIAQGKSIDEAMAPAIERASLACTSMGAQKAVTKTD